MTTLKEKLDEMITECDEEVFEFLDHIHGKIRDGAPSGQIRRMFKHLEDIRDEAEEIKKSITEFGESIPDVQKELMKR